MPTARAQPPCAFLLPDSLTVASLRTMDCSVKRISCTSLLPSLDLPQSTSTGGFNAVVDGLTNGRNYRFRVQAYNAKFLRGGEAQVGRGKCFSPAYLATMIYTN